jgi:hypothetical protein
LPTIKLSGVISDQSENTSRLNIVESKYGSEIVSEETKTLDEKHYSRTRKREIVQKARKEAEAMKREQDL